MWVENDFFDRKSELGFLANLYESLSRGELVVVYGRRRLGKTLLLKKSIDLCKEGRALYFFVNLEEEHELKSSFSRDILLQTGDVFKISVWSDFFDYIFSLSSKQKMLVVIDEFQRLKAIAPSFITHLQNHWDSRLKNSRLLLALVGSSIGMMTKIALSGSGALYGRKTAAMRLKPFTYFDFREMFSHLSEEKKVEWYSVFGGTPYYLELSKKHGDLFEAIEKTILDKNAPLREEPKNLLELELRAVARYNSILHCIAYGKQTIKEISDSSGIACERLPVYLNTLIKLLELVEKRDPLFGRKNAGRYVLNDNFFKFWYRFVMPQNSLLEFGETSKALEKIRVELPSHTGKAFEGIVMELFKRYNGRKFFGLHLDFTEIGCWWDKSGNEIDLLIPNKNELILCEVKWTAKPVDASILTTLQQKANLLNKPGKRQFVLVSKNGFTSDCIELAQKTRVITLNLADIQKLYDEA